jgi:hypothetical protein
MSNFGRRPAAWSLGWLSYPSGNLGDMKPTRIVTAEDLEKLTPAEQDELFQSSIIRDLEQVEPEFLALVRSRLEERIALETNQV